MRIIAGSLKGKKLYAAPGSNTRPTGAKLREAVFGITAPAIPGARVLDLFAGTGAYALEALSRGALDAVLIDADTAAMMVIKKNIRLCQAEQQTQCYRWDIARDLNCIRGDKPGFDLVFMDPPYEHQDLITLALKNLSDGRCLKNEAQVLVEHGAGRSDFPEGIPSSFEIADRRKYGKSLVTFLNYMI